MALSSASRQAVRLAAGWAAAVVCTAIVVTHLPELRSIAQSVVGSEPRPARAAEHGSGQPQQGHPAAFGGRVVELKAGANGHFQARAEINGRPVAVLVDTGASMVALTDADASAVGLHVRDSDFTHRVSTANGMARVALVSIDRVSIGDITVRNVPGAVLERGKLETTLLGMSFLSRLQRVDMRSGLLVLHE
jgi:aspartyl protease family protein